MQKMDHGKHSLLIFAGVATQSSDSMLKRAASISGGSSSVRLLDSRRVFGEDHIRSALQKAARAFDNQQNVSDSLATETMLYMSGCRQIQEAVSLLGLRKDSSSIVCIADANVSIEKKLPEFPINEDATIIEGGEKDLSGFGVTSAELSTVPEAKRLELVLEHVASVDIKKK